MTSNEATDWKTQFRKERLIVYLLTFVMGGCGIAYEYTLSKISSDLLGNSVAQWAIIIGLMMFFMGIGSDLQKYIRDENILDRFIVFEIVQGMLGAFGPIALFYIFGSYRDYYILVQYFLVVSIGLVIGLEIPLLMRINQRYTPDLKINLGGILRMDYIGAFVGAVFWLFVLLRFLSLIQVGFVLGLLNVLVSGITFFYFRRVSLRRVLYSSLIAFSLLLIVIGFANAPTWSRFAEQQLFLDRIIFSKTTRYQHIVITETDSGDIYCYINGNLQFSSVDEHIYHEFLVHPVMQLAPARRKVLVLGGGDGLAVRELLEYPDVESITLVDIDPEMTDIARDNPEISRLNKNSLKNDRLGILKNHALVETGTQEVTLEDQTRFNSGRREAVATVYTVNLDAKKFVEQISGVYDVIIIDFPDPNNIELAKLYSLGFYRKIYTKLSQYGVMVQQSTSPVHAKEAFLCIGRTMAEAGLAVVPFHHNVPTFGEWGWWVGGRDDAYSPSRIKRALESPAPIAAPTRYLSTDLLSASLVFGKGSFDTVNDDVNTILNNTVYKYYFDAVEAME